MSLRARSLKDIFTFTRSTTATYFDINGTLTTAAVDEPRVEYDPATGAVRGLLIEEARTNYLGYSQDMSNVVWSKLLSSISADATVAPDGTTTADKLVEDTTASDLHYATQTYAKDSASEVQIYTLSVMAKSAGRTSIRIIATADPTLADSMAASFDLSAATAGAVSAAGQYDNGQSRAELCADGWVRCSLCFRVNNDSNASIVCYLMLESGGNTTYTGDGASGVYLWGAQLEKGVYATSYIPTTSTGVARSADICTTSVLDPWFNEEEGTFFAEYVVPWTFISTDALNEYVLQIDIGAYDDRHALLHDAGKPAAFTAVSEVAQANPIAANVVTAGTAKRVAYAWALNDVAYAVTGASVVTDSDALIPSGLTTLRLGAYFSGAQALNGYIRKIKFYPRRLTNTELAALVA